LLDVSWADGVAWGGETPDDLHQQLGNIVDHWLDFVFAGRVAQGSYAQTCELDADPLVTAYFEPSIKEYARYETSLFDFGDFGGLRNFNRRVTGYHLNRDAAMESLAFTPLRPRRGDVVSLGGATAASTLVSARIGNRSLGSVVSDAQGAFALTFTAPWNDDDSPASEDGGSFGVEVEASGVGRSVLTLQLDRARNAANPLWVLYN